MTDEHQHRNPIPSMLIVVALIGGGWYFLQHYQISGLDGLTVREKSTVDSGADLGPLRDDFGFAASTAAPEEQDLTLTAKPFELPAADVPTEPVVKARNLRIGSWSLEGLDTNALADETLRKNLAKIIRQFDLIALQQIPYGEPDLLVRVVEIVNEGDPRYEFMIGDPTGPRNAMERLAFLFDAARLQVDRTQSYTVADPDNQMMFDPQVAWFRARGPAVDTAWTFSLVNVRVDLARAPQEVVLLSNIFAAVRLDGRGEDDVVMAGLFQADDAYLLPTIGDANMQAAVRNKPTDILGRHQISNLLINSEVTSEYVGRGGAFDFLRTFNLSVDEAKSLSTQLPVYAEFTATEGRDF